MSAGKSGGIYGVFGRKGESAGLGVEDVKVSVPLWYGRRPRGKSNRLWKTEVFEYDELGVVTEETEERKVLTLDDVTVQVDMEVEEELFYSNEIMSDVECVAVTTWLEGFADETLDLFRRSLQKGIDDTNALMTKFLLSEGQDVVNDSELRTENDLAKRINALTQRLDVVSKAQLAALEEEDDDVLSDDGLDMNGEKRSSQVSAKFLTEVTQERSKIEARLNNFFNRIFHGRFTTKDDTTSSKANSDVKSVDAVQESAGNEVQEFLI